LRDFVSQNRETYGVEPICKVLQIAPSGYRRAKACRGPLHGRALDATPGPARSAPWQGGAHHHPDANAPCPLDRVNRQFKADRPNQLWVSDFTYVSTWQGWQYVAFVIDVYARRIVGWRQSSSMRTDFVLDALEQALYDRQPNATMH
jgi:putative transposase